MDPFTITRLVYDGCDPSDTWIITAIGHSKLDMKNVDVMNVSTFEEYEEGCRIHPNTKCAGHLCRTPHGNILPMQSLSVSTGVITNDVSRSAKFAFGGSNQYHSSKSKEVLLESMKGKTGRMRKGIVNCHVDGSLRMVITPQLLWSHEWVAIPRYLSDKWTVVYLDEKQNKYKSRNVSEGDYAILIRPPSLSIKSVQPVRIRFWDKTCMGVSPYIVKAFDGDYDGDEMHVFPVYSENSINECKNWINTKHKKFDMAFDIFRTLSIEDKSYPTFDDIDSTFEHKIEPTFEFMNHTTMPFDEIFNGSLQPLLAEETRTTKEHLDSFKLRYNTDEINRNFVPESIRGMADTNAQQLSQPIVGDMSRIAKLAASCVVHRDDGMIVVCTRTGYDIITKCDLDVCEGSPSVRGISTMCAGVQQIALESHHAKKKSLPSHDMISEMMTGGDETFVILSRDLNEHRIRSSIKPRWINIKGDCTYILCEPKSLSNTPSKYIIASYNPEVLSFIPKDRRLDACRMSMEHVIRYYSFALSKVEIECISVLFSYNVEKSKKPITTRDGMKHRMLRWTEVMMANHYGELKNMMGQHGIDPVPLDTVSSRLMSGNFIGY